MDMQITALEPNPASLRPRSGSCGRTGPEGGVLGKLSPLSQQIWDAKYRLKADDGTPIDVTVEDSWRRVARALAAAEKSPEQWEVPFYQALEDFRLLPAGRILAGAGTGRRVTLFNCFVMGNVEDDLGAIFNHLREAALTMQQGGGIGYDFSSLRPKGAPVRGVGADASGPLSFMDVWNAMCRTIMSAGARRGAMMATLRCDHPDIEAFIAAKREPGRLRNFNLSVLVSDAFMAAVERDEDWPLVFAGQVFRIVRAKALWDSITRATYDCAEPGVIFIDRINARNNLAYCETITATNPCGEEPLPPYGACLLGSINLARLVRQPFTSQARINEDELAGLVGIAVRMVDNTIDVSRFPLEAQRQEAFAKRRIGLGMTGLADALIMTGLRYGSPEAAAQAERWAERISHTAYRISCGLAVEKGAFPLFDREAYLAGETISALPDDIRERIAAGGIRNALLTSIAPTGTISLFMPTGTFASCPNLDLICVPGGSTGVAEVLRDGETIEFVRHQADAAKYVTSVCTGAFVLGAAGLLRGRRATTHWAFTDLLPLVGATHVRPRVVKDGNLITAGGVTSGIDFGLSVAAELAGEIVAQSIQLGIEYDPAPPFDAGHPDRAPEAAKERVSSRYERMRELFRASLADQSLA